MGKMFTDKYRLAALVGGSLFQCCMIGTLINTVGVILGAVSTDLGMDAAQVGLFYTMRNLAGMTGGLVIVPLYYHIRREIVIIGAAGVVVVAHLLMTFYSQPWQFYASAVLSGLVISLASVILPHLFAPVFGDKAGTAIGIGTAFSGVGGVVFNPLGAALIRAFGWRTAIFTTSTITAVLAVTGIALLLYGLAHATPMELTPKHGPGKPPRVEHPGVRGAKGPVVFALCAACFFCSATVVQFYGQMPLYAQGLGYTLAAGATLSSCCMAGNIGGKLLIGVLADRMGVWRAMRLMLIIVGGALAVFLLVPGVLPLLYLAGLLFGFVYGVGIVTPALCCAQVYGSELSQQRLGIHLAINSGLGAVASLIIGKTAKQFGGYTVALVLCAVLCACSIVAITVLRRRVEASRSTEKETAPE